MRPACPTYKRRQSSHITDKVALRLAALAGINKTDIRVLDAYAGDGTIWDGVQARTKKKIHLTRIEKHPGHRGTYLQGDNLKYLASLDLSQFDLIDLDAYGVPYRQLQVIFKKGYQGTVACTFIQKVAGRLHDEMLQELGYTWAMIKRTPTLFCRKGIQKFERYLALHGVTQITIIEYDRKAYLYFQI